MLSIWVQGTIVSNSVVLPIATSHWAVAMTRSMLRATSKASMQVMETMRYVSQVRSMVA